MAPQKGQQFFVHRGEEITRFKTENERIQFLKDHPDWKSGMGKPKYRANNGRKTRFFYSKEKLNKFLSENPGWVEGFKSEPKKLDPKGNRIFITNESRRKWFNTIEDAQKYINEHQGWRFGSMRIDPRNHPMYGKHHKESTKELLSKATAGRIHLYNESTGECRQLKSNEVDNFLKNNPGFKVSGVPKSEETCKKISESKIGKTIHFSEERNKHLSDVLKGHPVSDETRRKMSLAKRNPSDETRKRLSKASIERLAKIPNSASKTEKYIRSYLSNYLELGSGKFRLLDGSFHLYDFHVLPIKGGRPILGEFDGDFFHSSKNYKWNPNRDELRKLTAEALGYDYFVIKECDFRANGGLKYIKKVLSQFIDGFEEFSLSRAKEIKSKLYSYE